MSSLIGIIRGCGVIGSRARLRIWCREACRFESYHPHTFSQILEDKQRKRGYCFKYPLFLCNATIFHSMQIRGTRNIDSLLISDDISRDSFLFIESGDSEYSETAEEEEKQLLRQDELFQVISAKAAIFLFHLQPFLPFLHVPCCIRIIPHPSFVAKRLCIKLDFGGKFVFYDSPKWDT